VASSDEHSGPAERWAHGVQSLAAVIAAQRRAISASPMPTLRRDHRRRPALVRSLVRS